MDKNQHKSNKNNRSAQLKIRPKRKIYVLIFEDFCFQYDIRTMDKNQHKSYKNNRSAQLKIRLRRKIYVLIFEDFCL